MGTEGEAKIRLTKNVRQQLLDQNDGYADQTYYQGNNFREQRDYEIRQGQLHIRSRGKTSWADSHFDEQIVADDQQTRRFLRNNLHALNTDGLGTPVARTVAAGLDQRADPSDDASSEDRTEDPIYFDFEQADDDEYDEDPEMDNRVYAAVGGALIAYFAVRAVAPHARRWWSESLAPRAQRMRQKVTRGAPADEAGGDGQSPAQGADDPRPDGATHPDRPPAS